MKKILCLGCSWTYGAGLSSDKTYPYLLQAMLNDCTVINAGFRGIDIPFTLYIGEHLIKLLDPDVILFQLTTLDRLTLTTNGKNNFLENMFHNDNHFNATFDDNNRLEYINSIPLLITQAAYLEAIERPSAATSQAIKFLFENYIFSNQRTESIIQSINNFRLTHKDRDVYFFPFLNMHYRTFENISWIRQDSVINTVGEEYFIDNGFHLTEEGNKRMVEDYILPMLENV